MELVTAQELNSFWLKAGEWGIEAVTNSSKQTPQLCELWPRATEDVGNRVQSPCHPPRACPSTWLGWVFGCCDSEQSPKHLIGLQRPKSSTPSGTFGQTLTSDHSVSKLLLMECVHQKCVIAERCCVYPLQRQFPRKSCLSKPQVSVQAAKNGPDLSDCIRRQSDRTRERKRDVGAVLRALGLSQEKVNQPFLPLPQAPAGSGP